jgi:DNA mismatch endonuclease (patch repair protein)
MKAKRNTPSFVGRAPASINASRAARGSSKKAKTKCELVLRRVLWVAGFRYRKTPSRLPGRPDIVFPSQKVVVFCDGDFWHGRDLKSRLKRLAQGHNAPYWVAKIRTNVSRDQVTTKRLCEEGWHVVRLWETDILRDPTSAAARVAECLQKDSYADSLDAVRR